MVEEIDTKAETEEVVEEVETKKEVKTVDMQEMQKVLKQEIKSKKIVTEEQQKIMDEKINEYEKQGYSAKEAKKRAEKYVAIPDTSEHQLGLSVDINADTDKCSSEKVYQWLDENAYKYGFVKRYPEDKTDITGISNEPWHYRYVGTTVAKIMKEENLCLEEYLEKYK